MTTWSLHLLGGFALKRDGELIDLPHRKDRLLLGFLGLQYGRPVYFINDFHEISKSGVIGHPDLATAEKGQKFLHGIVKNVAVFVDEFVKW